MIYRLIFLALLFPGLLLADEYPAKKVYTGQGYTGDTPEQFCGASLANPGCSGHTFISAEMQGGDTYVSCKTKTSAGGSSTCGFGQKTYLCPYGGTLQGTNGVFKCVNAPSCPAGKVRDPVTGECKGDPCPAGGNQSGGFYALNPPTTACSPGGCVQTFEGQQPVPCPSGVGSCAQGTYANAGGTCTPGTDPTPDPIPPTNPDNPDDPDNPNNPDNPDDPDNPDNPDGPGDGEGEGEGDGSGDGEGDGDDEEGEEEEEEEEEKDVDVPDPESPQGFEEKFFKGVFDGLLSWSPSGSGSCPTASFSVFGQSYSINAHCQLAQENFGVFRAAMIAAWTILALFVVLKA